MRKLSSTIFILLVLFAPAALRAQAIPWLDPAWGFRNPVTVANPTGTTLTSFQVHVVLDASFDFSKTKAGGADLRFTDSTGTALLPFWIESWNPGGLTASLWIRVPSIPATGTTLFLYYGNPAAASVSNGNTTFDFFEDFDTSNSTSAGYFQLSAPQAALVQDQVWETGQPHTLSVVQANSGGFTYWGYYGLTDCGGAGLARSNDLVNWTKYSGNPLLTPARWPSVRLVGSTYYMVYNPGACSDPSFLNLATSTDGITFTDVKTLVPAVSGQRNQNAQLFFNPNDSKFYLYWYSGNDVNDFRIMARNATTPEGLDSALTEVTLLSSTTTMAAPNMMYYNGTYYLATEVLDGGGEWNVKVFSGTSPTGSFAPLPGNPVLASGAACMFQHIFGTTLHEYNCKLTSGVWTQEHRTADLTLPPLQFHQIDTSKWPGSDGTWSVLTDTQQDGTSGLVAKATTGIGHRTLISSYTGTDYVLEAYGRQLVGRVWGLAFRVADPNNMYSINLYEDLDASQNLWMYSWVNNDGSSPATVLGDAASGTVDLSAWYKLTVRVHGSSFEVLRNGVSQFITADAQFGSGAIALYGESGQTAEWDNIFVHKFATTDPSASLGATQVSAPSLTSVGLNPTTLVGGNPSTGTVTLNTNAPAGGTVVTLSSSNTAAATVPASVTVPEGSSSTTFTVTTNAVTATTGVTITASLAGVNKTATLTLNVNPLLSMTLNPAAVTGGAGSTGTVTLRAAAPVGGSVVALSSSNTAVATTPASVTVAAGATSANFAVSSLPVATSKTATITASLGGGTVSAILTVNPPGLSTITVNPASITGASNSTGTATLTGAAPTGGVVVSLSSSNTFVAATPATVTVPAGATSATFTITSSTVTSSTAVTITGTLAGVNRTATLTVTPPALLDLVLNPTTVVAGNISTGTVSLNGPAPAGGIIATLSSNHTDIATTPASVTVLAGATTADFPVTSLQVTTNKNVNISATVAAAKQNAALTVTPNPISALVLNPASVIAGSSSTGTVTLRSAAPPGGAIVALSSSNTSAATTPASVTVPAGATSANFAVTSFSVVSVTSVTITATYTGGSLPVSLTVSPLALLSVAMSPASVTGGTNSTGTVTLNGVAPAGGVLVGLSSDNAAAGVPVNVTVAGGASSATFTATSSPVASATIATVTASWSGANKTTTLTVNPPAPSTLTVNPASVMGTNPSTGTVTLTGLAPAAGITVSLTSSNTAVATVPANVSVTGGTNSASFPISTSAVAANTSVTITATANAVSKTATLTVTPNPISALTMSPASVVGGSPSTGTVTLRSAAPPGGAVVALSSSDTSVATTPASVTVAGGATSASFTVTTLSVGAPTNVTITAAYGGGSLGNSLAVGPLGIVSVAMSPTAVTGGSPSTGTVTLNGPAPAGGSVVTLGSSNTSAATVPASVTVAAGATTGTFTATSIPVSATATATFTASFAGVDKTATLTVNPPALSTLALNPTAVVGTNPSTGTVTLTGPAPAAGFVVGLTSSNTAAATVPANATVAGGTSSVTFTVTTSGVAAATNVTITGSASGVTKTATLTVNTNPIATLTLSPTSVTSGGTSTGTVTLASAAPNGGAVVTLSSSTPATASVPVSVTVAAKATSASFTVTSFAVASATPVTISASYSGGSRTAILTVNPAALNSVAMSPATVTGGVSSTGTVTLNGPAPAGGALITLSSSDTTKANPPASVTVAANATTATFTTTTSAVAAPTSITITASYGGVDRTATLTLNPPTASVASVTLNPTSVVGGTTSTGTVTLGLAAPAGGAVVTLSSSNTAAATVPASVTVAAGATTANFTATSKVVAANTNVTITATYNGTATAILTVTLPSATTVALNPGTVLGGATSTGTVTLNGAAPTGGASVALSSSDTTSATVPASVTVAAGATSATFTVTSKAVATATAVTITATYNGTATGTLNVNPPTASSLTLNPTSVSGGSSSTGTVTLTGAAPTGGISVTLSSGNTGVATVPASVTVAAGATTATFTVTTFAVASATPVTISATLGVTQNATLTVNPPAPIAFVQGVSSDHSNSPSTSSTAAFSAATKAGDLVVVGVAVLGSVSSVTDSQGNAYTLAASTTSPAGVLTAVYYARNVKAAANTVTVTFAASSYNNVDAMEYSGLSTTAPVDRTAVGSGTGTTASAGPTATTTAANELIFAFAQDDGSSFSAGGPGFTVRSTVAQNCSEDAIVSATGAFSASCTWATTTGWAMVLVTFK